MHTILVYVTIWQRKISAKVACKMLVKLTPTVDVMSRLYNNNNTATTLTDVKAEESFDWFHEREDFAQIKVTKTKSSKNNFIPLKKWIKSTTESFTDLDVLNLVLVVWF